LILAQSAEPLGHASFVQPLDFRLCSCSNGIEPIGADKLDRARAIFAYI
jgi:hypothetical protein